VKHNRKTQDQNTRSNEAEAPVVVDAEAQPAVTTEAVVKTKATKKPARLTEEALLAKYPHIVPGTLRFETEGKHALKQTVEATLACGHVTRIATSDLFQKKACDACKHPVKTPKPKAEKKVKGPKAESNTTEAPVVFEHQKLDAETRALALNAQ
jgi:hypothetical protein